jgi:Cd2+/Zn2+-exporting ATPase
VNRAQKTAFVKLENKNIPLKSYRRHHHSGETGEMIPLDGKIISGETTVDEAAITGEPSQASWCYFICRNTQQNGFIEMETTTLSIDTTFAKIIRLTFEAAASKVTQKFIQRFSKFYTLA